ncbi:MAG: patatin-like phospholipase family protein [Bacteroidota bacterium]
MDKHTSLVSKSAPSPPRIALVLSSGGVKGMIHIGCIEALRQAEIPIDLIVGCSAGALVGGLYASELDTQYIYNLALKVLPTSYSYRLFGLPSIREGMAGNGIFSTNGIESILTSSMKAKTFEELTVPLKVVATNLNTGNLDEFSEGNLVKPICASSAIPGFFSPVSIGNNVYLDGAIVSNLPVRNARKAGAKIVIACNIPTSFQELKQVDNAFLRSYTIFRQSVKDQEIKEADILIEVKTEASSLFTKRREAHEMYQLGKQATEKMIPEIKKIMQTAL